MSSVSNPFKIAVSEHLQALADKDPLFAETYAKPAKNIDECLNYILQEVKKSGHSGFADDEIFAMAIHYYDEDDIKDVKAVSAKVIVNHSLPADKSKRAKEPAEVSTPKKVSTKKAQPVNQSSISF